MVMNEEGSPPQLKSANWLEIVFDSNPLGISLINLDARIIHANPAYCVMLGFTLEELRTKTLQDITYPEDRQQSLWLRSVRTQEQPQRFQKRYVRKDGQIIWVDVQARVILGEDRQPVYGLAIVEDITEQKLAYQEISEAREELQRVLDMSPECIWSAEYDRAGDDFQFRYVSPSMEEVFGLSVSTILSQPYSIPNAVHPDDRQMWQENSTKASRADFDADEMEYRIIRPDGEIRWVRDSIRVTHLSDTKIRLDGVTADITERKRRDEELRISEARNRALTEAIPDMIFEINRKGQVEHFKPSKKIAPFYPPEEFLGKTLEEFLPAPLGNTLMQAIERTFHSGEPQTLEYDIEKERSHRDLESRFVLHDENKVIEIVRDISDRKQAERELQKRDIVLEAVASVSHKLVRSTQWQDVIDEVLEQLTKAIGMERARLFENSFVNGEWFTSIRYEWVTPGLQPLIGIPLLQNFSYWSVYDGGLVDELIQNHIIKGHVRDFADQNTQNALRLLEVKSIILLPILAQGDWWGLLIFDTCTNEHVWSVAEEDALKTAAIIIGAAVQRWQIEETLHEAQQRYRTLVDTSPDAIIYTDETWNILLANPQAALHFGFDHEDALENRNLTELIVPDERERLKEVAPQLYEKGVLRNVAYTCLRKPGTRFPAEFSFSTVWDAAENVKGFVVIHRDITERKIADSALTDMVTQMQDYTHILKQRANISNLYTELIGKLQFCTEPGEVFEMFTDYMEKIFPEQNGALYIEEEEEELYSAVSAWGRLTPKAASFRYEDCIALHTGQVHLVYDRHARQRCAHIHADSYICIPVSYHNKILGIINLQNLAIDNPTLAWQQQFLGQIAESLALILSNIALQKKIEPASPSWPFNLP